MLFVSFGKKIAYIAYNSKSIVDSILSQSVSKILRDNLYELKQSIVKMTSTDRYLIITHDSQLILFENAFSPATVSFSEAGVIVSDTKDSGGLFAALMTPEVLRAIMIPLAILIVIVYQLYCKKKAPEKPKLPRNKEDRDKEFQKRFNNLSSSLGSKLSDSTSPSGQPYRRTTA